MSNNQIGIRVNKSGMPSIAGFTTSAFDPASRVRFIQFIPGLERMGWNVRHFPNRPDRQWTSSLRNRVVRAVHHRLGRVAMKVNRWNDLRHTGAYDIVFVNRDLAGGGLFFERELMKRNRGVVFDFDDAIFMGENERAVGWMCEHAAWVTPGNEYLAAFARQYTDRVTVVPTVIDTDRYATTSHAGSTANGRVRVGWSGSDQSIGVTLFPYLALLADIQKKVDFEFVIITNTRPSLPVSGFRWSFVPWSAEGESTLANVMDIGLMPLKDDPFQRGKCGLKLLQYMAAGIPTVASPVGVNKDITVHGTTGYLATHPQEWEDALHQLVLSADQRRGMGHAGRARCEKDYSIHRWLPELTAIFDRIRKAP